MTKEDLAAGSSSEALYEGTVPEIEVLSPAGEIDTVPANVRAYLLLAEERYAGLDFSESVRKKGEEFDGNVFTEFRWQIRNPEDLPDGIAYELQLSETEDFKDPVRVSLKVTKPEKEQVTKLCNLKTGTAYFWKVTASLPEGAAFDSGIGTFSTKDGPRVLYVAGVKNFRDLGGFSDGGNGTLKQGLLYRSARLETAEEYGIDTMTKDLGIRTEIDLRNPKTEEVLTSLPGDRVNVVNLPGSSYERFISNPAGATEVLRLLADPANYPAILHCYGGADRTGALAFLLKAYAGCPVTELVTDYELTANRFCTGYVTEENNFDFPAFYEAFQKLSGADPAEKAKTFILSSGLSVMEAHNLRAILTGKGALFVKPPKARVRATDGKIAFTVQERDSGKIISVRQGETVLPFAYENGLLTVTVTGSGDGTAELEDGTTMPFNWR